MKAKFIPAGSEPSQFILAGIKPIKLALRRGYLVESMPVSQLRIPFLRFHNCNREYYADGRAAGCSLFSFRLGRRHRISLKNVLIYDILAKEKAICDGGEQPLCGRIVLPRNVRCRLNKKTGDITREMAEDTEAELCRSVG